MDLTNELSSSEDEFCFDTVHDEIRRIYKKINGTESNESDEDDGIVVDVRTRKIRVIIANRKVIVMPHKHPINQNGQLLTNPRKYHPE